MNSVLIILLQVKEEAPLIAKIIIAVLFFLTLVLSVVVVSKSIFTFLEMAYVEYINKRLFFNHLYLKRNKLSEILKKILRDDFSFYNRLTPNEQNNFDHRLCYFLKHWEFIGKEIEVTDKMKVMVGATAVKLTFGLRDYKMECVNKVIIYPEAYYSTLNKAMHKGEFNMAFSALVFSWEDFLEGYTIANDNVNLGVHECIHALHFSYLKSRTYSTSAAIFLDAFQELIDNLDQSPLLKQKLIASGYFRDYAFENHFEFIAVLAESFIETPSVFRSQFPEIYVKVKEMLNFNVAGY